MYIKGSLPASLVPNSAEGSTYPEVYGVVTDNIIDLGLNNMVQGYVKLTNGALDGSVLYSVPVVATKDATAEVQEANILKKAIVMVCHDFVLVQ